MTAPSTNLVRVHTPSGVVLPESLQLERTYPSYYAEQEDTLSMGFKPNEADKRTLLCDIFRSPDGRKLHAIGPEPRNLLEELWPLTITVDGAPLRHRTRIKGVIGVPDPRMRLLFLEAKLPAHLAARDNLEANLQWRNFAATAVVNRPLPPSPKPLLTLTTLQKNNPLEWIRDWCLYNQRIHKVERIVLYDNGSDDFNALRAGLERLDGGPQVVLMRWNYPYGLTQFNYSQHSALNHCYLRFGNDTSHFINLDVDEYLVNLSGAPLAQHLERSLRGRFATLLVPHYHVRNLPTAPPLDGGPLRAHHFKHRRRKLMWHNAKTAFAPRHITYVHPHLNNHRLPGLMRRLVDTRRWAWRLVYSHHLTRSPLWLWRTQRWAAPDELYFNHYLGLNTGWQFEYPLIKSPDSAIDEPDPVVPALLERAGLAEESAE